MPTTTVTVAFVNQPKPGKQFGSIKDKSDNYYSVKPADLAFFQKGGTYEIEYDVTDRGYKNFKRIISRDQGGGATSANAGRDMFITGVVGRAMGSGKFGPGEIRDLAHEARAAWDSLKEGDRQSGELDDEIPF